MCQTYGPRAGGGRCRSFSGPRNDYEKCKYYNRNQRCSQHFVNKYKSLFIHIYPYVILFCARFFPPSLGKRPRLFSYVLAVICFATGAIMTLQWLRNNRNLSSSWRQVREAYQFRLVVSVFISRTYPKYLC